MKYREPWKTKKQIAREAKELASLRYADGVLTRPVEEYVKMHEVEHKRIPARALMSCRYRAGGIIADIFLCYASGEAEDCCARLCIGCGRRRA